MLRRASIVAFSGGENSATRFLQLALFEPSCAILDNGSGLDIDSLPGRCLLRHMRALVDPRGGDTHYQAADCFTSCRTSCM